MFKRFKYRRLDVPLFIATLLLLAVGIVAVYSASSYVALEHFYNRNKFFEQTLMWSSIGLVGMLAASFFSYRWLRKFSFVLLLICIGMLIYPLLSNTAIRETKRWFYIFGFQIQPSEFAKAGLIVYISAYLSRTDLAQDGFRNKLRYYIRLSIPIALIALLIFLQPNKSAAMVTGALALAIIFVNGAPLWYTLTGAVGGVSAFLCFSFAQEYSRARLMSFTNAGADLLGDRYQIHQSMIALGLGKVWGVGLGNSLQNKLYLPDPHNDFILAPIGEEFGMIGTVGLLILYAVMIYRCIKIAMQAPDRFSMLVCSGVAALLFLHVMINYMVVTALLPTTGITLPLLSYGGSSTIVFMGLLGIVQNIARHRVPDKGMGHEGS